MRPLSHAVPGALRELLQGGPLSDGKAAFAWRAAVGPALARVSTVRLDGRALVVEAATAHWAREITRSSAMILTRLQTLLGPNAVTRILVRDPDPGARNRRAGNPER